MKAMDKSVKVSKKGLRAIENMPLYNTPDFMKECQEIIPTSNKVVSIEQEKEIFLRLFIQGQETRNNKTRSYIMAKGQNPDEWDKTPLTREITDRMGKKRNIEIPKSSEYDKKYHVAETTAYQWLCQPRVNARRMQLTSELLKDHIVDNEMMKVIIQDKDLTAKNTAMREYNKLAQRIVDRKDIRTQSVGVIRHLYGEADTFGFDDED